MTNPLPKSEWGPGPWQHEPDHEVWVDPETGYTCEILRHMSVTGALCGYVCVPHGHPFRGKDYDALPEDVEVHGGITYARERVDLTGTTYWFGFDCAHAWDLCPAMVAFTRNMRGDSYVPIGDDVYRDWAYVRENVLALARSLKSHEKDPP